MKSQISLPQGLGEALPKITLIKFIVSSSDLLVHLNRIYKAIPSNPMLPILEDFYFELNENELSITASSIQNYMTTAVKVDSKVKGQSTSVTVPAKLLVDTLKILPEQPLSFAIDTETKQVSMDSDNGTYKMQGGDGGDYPKTPTLLNSHNLEFTSDILKGIVETTMFCTTTDELRASMNGVYFRFRSSHCLFVATDGLRIVRYEITGGTTVDADMIVHRKSLDLLNKSFPKDVTTIEVRWSKQYVSFSFSALTILCLLIDERFPDFEGVIAKDNPYILDIERLDLINSLHRIAMYSNSATRMCRLNLNADGLQIYAEDTDFERKAHESIICEYFGDAMEIGFNAPRLSECLDHLQSSNVTLSFMSPNRGVLIVPKEQKEGENLSMFVMPVMLPENL